MFVIVGVSAINSTRCEAGAVMFAAVLSPRPTVTVRLFLSDANRTSMIPADFCVQLVSCFFLQMLLLLSLTITLN